jgi:protein-L-isoaspartate(D-aspartate) O-methyltransferase
MGEINFSIARHNMVEQQIRPWDVLDQRVLNLIDHAPREDYVPQRFHSLAYVDMNIPIGHGQVMMAPRLEARLLQELAIRASDNILEIGTGSGYMSSLLAALGRHVYSVEILADFEISARNKLAAHEVANVTVEGGDGARGWEHHAPYDVILITGSLPLLPDSFKRSLAVGGRLIAIVGRSPIMEVKLIQRLDDDSWTEASLFETDLPPLINALQPDRFVF